MQERDSSSALSEHDDSSCSSSEYDELDEHDEHDEHDSSSEPDSFNIHANDYLGQNDI